MSARPFRALSVALAVALVLTLAALAFACVAITRNTDATAQVAYLVTDGSAPMLAALTVGEMRPSADDTYNLGIAQRAFANTVTTDPVASRFTRVAQASAGDLLMGVGEFEIGASAVENSDFEGAPFMPLAGGAMTGELDMNGRNLTQVNLINGKEVDNIVNVSSSTSGFLLQLTAADVATAFNVLAQNVVSTTSNQTMDRIAKFGAQNTLEDSGFSASQVVYDFYNAPVNSFPMWSGSNNTMQTTTVDIDNLVRNSQLANYMPLSGGAFTQPLSYFYSSTAAPSFVVAYKPITPLTNLIVPRNVPHLASLGTFTKVHDPLGEFSVQSSGITNLVNSPRWYRVQILLTVAALEISDATFFFEVRQGISVLLRNSISFMNTSETTTGYYCLNFETQVKFDLVNNIGYYMRVVAPAGADVAVTVADVTVIVSAL